MGSEHVVRRVRRCEDSGDARDVIAVLTISQYRDDVDVQAECLRVLGNMCSGNDENRRVAGRRGAIQAAVDAMTRHEGNENVQKKGYGNFVASWLWWLRRTNKSPRRR